MSRPALADVADGVEQLADLLRADLLRAGPVRAGPVRAGPAGVGPFRAVRTEAVQRGQRPIRPGHLQVGHRDQVVKAEQLEEDAVPVRAAQRAGEPLPGLAERL